MIQNYFGEETIWKLLANHPYEKNNAQSITLYYRAMSKEDNDNIVYGFLQTIPRKHIIEVVKEDAPKSWWSKDFWAFKVVKQIKVRNVFGNESEVIIMNM